MAEESEGAGGGVSGRKQSLIIRRYWEIVNMYPRISDPELAEKIESFTMNATPEQLFRMQEKVIEKGAEYMAVDPGWRGILEKMDGEKVGLAIGDEYETTVSLKDYRFKVERGIAEKSIPVLSVASRKDYVDALLRRKDIVKMLMMRKLRASGKITLVKWGLSFFDLMRRDDLFNELISHQAAAEDVIKSTIEELDF